MSDQVVVLWRASSDARLIDVLADDSGGPRLLDRKDVTERIVDVEQDLLEYLRSGGTERIAVPRDLAHATLGWDL